MSPYRDVDGIVLHGTTDLIKIPDGQLVLARPVMHKAEPNWLIGTYHKGSGYYDEGRGRIWEDFISWFYRPILVLRDPEKYGPAKAPVTKNPQEGVHRVRECTIGIDEICKVLEGNPQLRVHIDWVRKLEKHYSVSLAKIFKTHKSMRIVLEE